jgi:hypothetical protein
MSKIGWAALLSTAVLFAASPALAGNCADVAAAYGKAMAAAPDALPPILDGWDGVSGMPLMYMSDDGTISANIACNPNRDINTLRFEIDYAAGGQDKALASFSGATEAFAAALDPQANAADAAKAAADAALKSGKGSVALPLGDTYVATLGARHEDDGSGKLTFFIKPK